MKKVDLLSEILHLHINICDPYSTIIVNDKQENKNTRINSENKINAEFLFFHNNVLMRSSSSALLFEIEFVTKDKNNAKQ